MTYDEIFDPERLLGSIRDYRNLDLKHTSLETVIEKLSFYNSFNLIKRNIGGIPLFRVRPFEKPDEKHSMQKDVWCKPAHLVDTLGRCNDVGESIFYGALDPITAMKETRIQKGDRFSLSAYDLIADPRPYSLPYVHITIPKDGGGQTKGHSIYNMILSDFAFTEFTKPVGKGTEFLYKASCAISKTLLSMSDVEALIYPSVQNHSKLNMAIPEDIAKMRLKLISVAEVKLLSDITDDILELEIISDSLPDGSDSLKRIPFTGSNPKTLSYETFFKGSNPTEMINESLENFSAPRNIEELIKHYKEQSSHNGLGW